jgi:transposase
MHAIDMYIRRTKTKTLNQSEAYYTYRIVESMRLGQKVKQHTLLNLGKVFSIDPAHWPLLCARIEQILQGSDGLQSEIFDLADELNQTLEAAAQRYSALILHKHSIPVESTVSSAGHTGQTAEGSVESDYHRVDINHLQALDARSIGAETLALHAVQQLQLDQKLTALGFNGVDLAAAIGSIIGRMVAPGSELSTHDWLQHRSCLGEMIDYDYGNLRLTRLYTVSDKLLKHQVALESHLATQESNLFNLQRSVVLYDLTNTYFEGQCHQNPKAQFGRSKEKRSDCPLVTLGLVLDGEGFPLTSQVFPGNASEPATLQTMIADLRKKHSPNEKPIVIMDAGIASQANIDWLTEHGHHYLVVSREQRKRDPREQADAVLVRENSHNKVTVVSETDADTQETRLYCHSEQKAKKEQAIRNRFHIRLEEALNNLHTGLGKKGTTKNYEKILQKIGRLREKNSRVAADYQIDVLPDDKKNNAIAIQWQRQPASQKKDQNSGVYCLRTNISDWSEEQLWNMYIMLTEIEATFRSLKTELGLRPIYHHKEERVTGHLFISLLAYHLVHSLRFQLKQQGIHLSWDSLRNIMSTQQRITLKMPTDDNKTIHLRTTTQAEVRHKKIYDALGVKYDPLGKNKMVMDNTKSVVPTGPP